MASDADDPPRSGMLPEPPTAIDAWQRGDPRVQRVEELILALGGVVPLAHARLTSNVSTESTE